MIYIIDFYKRNGYGHFWTQDSYLRKAFSEENVEFVFLSPDADLARAEDNIAGIQQCGYYEKLQGREFTFVNVIEYLRQEILVQSLDKVVLLFSWLPQISEADLRIIETLCELVETKVVGIAPVNAAVVLGQVSDYRYYFEKEFEKTKAERVLWVWDDVESYSSATTRPYIRRLPEYQSFQRLDLREDKNLSVSFFGMLSPFRGVAEILLIALFNPKLQILIRGHGFVPWKTWRPFKNKLFRYQNWKQKPLVSLFSIAISTLISGFRFLPNVNLINLSFPTENDLDEAISKANIVFYGAKLPLSSGIALKALASGIPVVWFGEEGEAFNFLIQNSKEGRIAYHEIFVYNRIYKKVLALQNFRPAGVFTWEEYKKEVISIRRPRNLALDN